jgi:hypothetical protein
MVSDIRPETEDYGYEDDWFDEDWDLPDGAWDERPWAGDIEDAEVLLALEASPARLNSLQRCARPSPWPQKAKPRLTPG